MNTPALRQPTTWSLKRLGDLAQILDHLRIPVNSEERDKRTGSVPYFGANGIQGYIDKPLFNEPLVLLAEDGGNFDDFLTRSIAYRIDGPSWVNNHAHILRSIDSSVVLSFLFHALEHRDIRRYISGGTRGKLTQAELCSIEVLTPPTAEQARIAEVLDTLDEAIRRAESVIIKLSASMDGLRHDALSQGILPSGELRPDRSASPHLYKHTQMGWIPKEWDLSTVGEQFDIQLGKMLDAGMASGELRPYIGNKAVQWDKIKIDEAQLVALSREEMRRFRLMAGDLLICEGGEVGRAAIWNEEIGECYYQKALHRLRPSHDYRTGLLLEFLHYWTSRDMLSDYVTKTSIAHLTQEKLSIIPLPVPSEAEQQRILDLFEDHKQRQRFEEEQLGKLSALKSGLTSDLLTGRVRTHPR